MPQRKHKPEEIVAKLRQVDVLVSQGRPVAEAICAIGVTPFGDKPPAPAAISWPAAPPATMAAKPTMH